METKVCKICLKEKELTEYYNQKKKRKDGTIYLYYPPYCRECTIKKTAEWSKENIERKYASNRKYNATQRNKELERIRHKRFIESGGRQKWISRNREKMREYANKHRKHDITNKQWKACKEYFDYRCAYCGITEEEHRKIHKQRLHKEHVHPEGNNDLSNCIPACKNCNSQKYIHPLEEWYCEDNEIFDQEKLSKIHKWIEVDYRQFINK